MGFLWAATGGLLESGGQTLNVATDAMSNDNITDYHVQLDGQMGR